jgi:hypothetical protein
MVRTRIWGCGLVDWRGGEFRWWRFRGQSFNFEDLYAGARTSSHGSQGLVTRSQEYAPFSCPFSEGCHDSHKRSEHSHPQWRLSNVAFEAMASFLSENPRICTYPEADTDMQEGQLSPAAAKDHVNLFRSCLLRLGACEG